MKKIVFMFLGMLLIACNRQDPKSNILKVQLVRSGAWSDYGAAISIDSSLNYNYYSRNLRQGYFGGKISRKFWDSLNQKFKALNFKVLPTDTHAKAVPDGEYFELIIYWKDGKTIVDRSVRYRSPNPVDQTFSWLNNSFKKVRLHRLKDPVKFETSFDNIPPLSADSGEFLPPLLDK